MAVTSWGRKSKRARKEAHAYVGAACAIGCLGDGCPPHGLMALQCRAGGHVFTTPCLHRTAEMKSTSSRHPVFVDIDPRTFQRRSSQTGDCYQCGKIKMITFTPLTDNPQPITWSERHPRRYLRPARDYDTNLHHRQDPASSSSRTLPSPFGAEYKGKRPVLANIACTSFFRSPRLLRRRAYFVATAPPPPSIPSASTAKALTNTTPPASASTAVWTPSKPQSSTKLSSPEEVQLRQEDSQPIYGVARRRVSRPPHLPPDNLSVWAQYSVLAKDGPNAVPY